MNRLTKIGLCGVALASVGFLNQAGFAATLITDGFDRADANLNGQSPDQGASSWTASNNTKILDGEVWADRTGGSEAANIEFTLDPGTQQVVVSANLKVAGVDWLGLGFSRGGVPAARLSGNDAGGGGELWFSLYGNGDVVLRGKGTTQIGDTVQVEDFDADAYHLAELTYNTTDNTATLSIDGATIFSGVSYTAGETPLIQRGSFQFQAPVASSGARVDDFTVSTIIPEPAASALIGVGMLLCLRRQ